MSDLPDDKRAHWLQPGVGHYGVFNGSRFRSEIAPRISDFILSQEVPRREGEGGTVTTLRRRTVTS